MSLRTIFAGTPEFAAVALQQLLDSEHEVIAVYTQPDRPAGRGRKLTASAVKQLALQHDIPVYQPQTLKQPEDQQQLADLNADVMIVAAYGLLLPQVVLDTPRYGCLNIHASLLPRWRGAAPIQRAISAGDSETGITIMQMDKGLDTGAMLLRTATPIVEGESAQQLHDRLAIMGGEALLQAMQQLEAGALQPQPQQEELVTYASKLTKEEALIDWNRNATELARLVAAFNPWPVCYSYWQQQPLRIWQATALAETSSATAGTVVRAGKEGVDVVCGNGLLRITSLQLPGKKAIAAEQFANAYTIVGDLLQSQAE